jgi:hypothetical protein
MARLPSLLLLLLPPPLGYNLGTGRGVVLNRHIKVLLLVLLATTTGVTGISSSGSGSSDPVTVLAAPTAVIRDFAGVPATLSWNITASYESSPTDLGGLDDDMGFPLLHIPVLFFPSPGTTTLSVGSHPCVLRSPTACCLMDFAEQYTSVAFSAYMRAQSAWLTRETCAGIADLRPLVRGIYDSPGLAESMVTGALDGIDGTSIALSSHSVAGETLTDVHVTIPHAAMRALMATPLVDPVDGTLSSSTLTTFVGFMWLRTRPVATLTRGIEIPVLQRAVTLFLTDQFITAGIGVGGDPSACSVTPQVNRIFFFKVAPVFFFRKTKTATVQFSLFQFQESDGG